MVLVAQVRYAGTVVRSVPAAAEDKLAVAVRVSFVVCCLSWLFYKVFALIATTDLPLLISMGVSRQLRFLLALTVFLQTCSAVRLGALRPAIHQRNESACPKPGHAGADR